MLVCVVVECIVEIVVDDCIVWLFGCVEWFFGGFGVGWMGCVCIGFVMLVV